MIKPYYEKRNKTMYKLSMIATGIVINMCLGSVYSWSVFRKPIEETFNIHSMDSGLPFMVFLITYAFTMPFAGNYIEKLGAKRMTFAGGVFISSGWIFSGFVDSIFVLTLTYGILGGMGVGIIYGVPLAVSAKWFPSNKGLALGLTLAGFGLSPFVTAPLAQKLIQSYSVSFAFIILGSIFFLIISLSALWLKFPESSDKINLTHLHTGNKISMKELLSDIRFMTLWLTFAIGTFSGLMAIGISSPVGQEIIGISSEQSAAFVSLFAIFNAGGRLLFGAITDKFKIKISASISYIIIIAASIMMLTAANGSIIIYTVSFSMFWLVLGGWLAIAPMSTMHIFGAEKYTRNYGYIFTAYGAGAILSTVVSGIIKDHFSSYHFVFVPTMLLAIFGFLIMIFFKDNVPRKSENII